jgi:zinc protease
MTMSVSRVALLGAVIAAALGCASAATAATKIERVVSPGGIEAWLVRDSAVPLIALDFAMGGGGNQDPAEKPGVGHLVAGVLDEGAGDLDARAFQERMDRSAIELNFRVQRDDFRGSLRVLRDHTEEGFELLRLALNAPRFDADAIERNREQMLTALRRETTNPNDIANRLWWRTAFPDHPYGRPLNGTLESVPLISRDDLKAYAASVFARDKLKIGVVGDIDAVTVGNLLDKVFGALPAKGNLASIAPVRMDAAGRRLFVDLKVPQAVLNFGGTGVARKDPDFIPAFILNHIMGGGSFSSRLYKEVREKRGLVYGVYTYLLPLDETALLMGGTQTRAEKADETLELIQSEIKKLIDSGPSADELDKAKSYLKGAYALNFDTSTKIAGQLVQIQLDNLGIDYIDRRNGLIDKVALDDIKRVAKRLLDGGILVTVVGRAQDSAAKKEGG